MRETWTRWTVVAGIVLAGCGQGSEGPVVGTWELDVEATMEANLAPALSKSREQFAKLEAEMKQLEDRIHAAPEAERAALREGTRAKMLEGAKEDADRTEVLKAMFRSMKEASDLVEKKARERVAGIAEAKVDLTFRPDQSFLMRFERDREIDVATGTWSLAGDQLMMTATAENGIPVAEALLEPHLMEAKEGRLERKSGPTVIRYRRRSGPETDIRLDPARVDPCAYVTAAEVAAVVGQPVRAAEPSGRSLQCAFETASEPSWQIVSIQFERRKADQADRFKASMGEKAPLAGFGDLAYLRSSGGFYVLEGDLSFAVFVKPRSKGHEHDAAAAKAIARLILSRLK